MKEKVELLKQLALMAKADNYFSEEERNFISAIARQIGVFSYYLEEIFEANEYQLHPFSEMDRMLQFQRLILMANVDLEIDSKELEMLKLFGFRLGFSSEIVLRLLDEMKKHEFGLIPTDKLIKIFQIQHN